MKIYADRHSNGDPLLWNLFYLKFFLLPLKNPLNPPIIKVMIAFFSPSRAKNQLKISFHFAKNEPAGDRIDPDLAICPCLT